MEGTEEGKMDSKIKIGVTLLIAQIALLALTMSFHKAMDASAERAGISQIIEEAGR